MEAAAAADIAADDVIGGRERKCAVATRTTTLKTTPEEDVGADGAAVEARKKTGCTSVEGREQQGFHSTLLFGEDLVRRTAQRWAANGRP